MLKKHITFSLRNLKKEKYYSVLNIAGLTIGLTAFLLLISYVIHETSYDSYQSKADRIYRIHQQGIYFQNDPNTKMAFMPYPLAEVLRNEFPEVELVHQCSNTGGTMVTTEDMKGVHEWSDMVSDSLMFEMFDFDIIEGNPKTALTEPYSVVISRELSEKLFGNESPIGKLLRIDSDSTMYRVTALYETPETNSHYRPSIVYYILPRFEDVTENWTRSNTFTYVLLKEGTSVAEFEKKLNGLIDKYYKPALVKEFGKTYDELYVGRDLLYSVMNIKDLHLHANVNMDICGKSGNASVTYIYLAIAFALLVLICINYINLSTSRSVTRMKEIAIRKAHGASKQSLIFQLVSESIVTVLFAVASSAIFTQLLMPEFSSLTQLEIEVPFFSNSWLVPSLLLFSIVLGILSGLYPAWMMSSFDTIEGLKSKNKNVGKGTFLRKILVVSQLSISFIVLTAAIITSMQFNYMMQKDWGYNRDNLITIQGCIELGDNQKAFKEDILQNPDIVKATFATNPLFNSLISISHTKFKDTSNAKVITTAVFADEDFSETLQLELLQGRMLKYGDPNEQFKCVINETAARNYGFDNPVGKLIDYPSRLVDSTPPMEIVGLVKDFNFLSLTEEIQPFEILLATNFNPNVCVVRTTGNNTQKVIEDLQATWNKYNSMRGMQYDIFDSTINWYYRNELSSKQTLFYFSITVIVLACLGLIGLISYSTLRRRKEIAVRKVNGATTLQIILMLSKSTVVFLAISFAIGIPVSYYLAKSWLNGFAYHIELSPILFAYTALLLFVISIATEMLVSQNAARKNPALALKEE